MQHSVPEVGPVKVPGIVATVVGLVFGVDESAVASFVPYIIEG